MAASIRIRTRATTGNTLSTTTAKGSVDVFIDSTGTGTGIFVDTHIRPSDMPKSKRAFSLIQINLEGAPIFSGTMDELARLLVAANAFKQTLEAPSDSISGYHSVFQIGEGDRAEKWQGKTLLDNEHQLWDLTQSDNNGVMLMDFINTAKVGDVFLPDNEIDEPIKRIS